MNSSTRLDSAVFQLTPTRTRCDLFISANGKKEKIASGLVNPFLSHLKAAQDQMEKGGYSIILEPENVNDPLWFTRGTLERFVRFVSTPEILERVNTTELEILQIEEAIAIQSNNSIGMSKVEESEAKPVENNEGIKPSMETNEEKAIVLYKPETYPPEVNETTTSDGNSKVQLLKVLETRKSMLWKEQGMAFARAVAAGFDVECMPSLISFAECFGAFRLLNACKKFMELWRQKHESGQWVEIDAADAMSSRSEFSPMNNSGIILSDTVTKSPSELQTGINGKANITNGDQQPPGHQDYVQGQLPQHMFPPWPMHSPPGTVPVYPPYPMHGMPYYHNYPGNIPYYQPPYPPVDDPRFMAGRRKGQRRNAVDSGDNNSESESLDVDAKSRSLDEDYMDDEGSQTRRKKGSRSAKRKDGTIVVRNINYITSKKENSSASGSQSDSASDMDEKTDLPAKVSKARGEGKESISKLCTSDKEETADSGQWLAFQSCLLRDADEDRHSFDQGQIEIKGTQRRTNPAASAHDPLASSGRDMYENQEGDLADVHRFSQGRNRMPKSSTDALWVSRRDGPVDGQFDLESSEIDARSRGFRRPANYEFLVHKEDHQYADTRLSSDLLAVGGLDYSDKNVERKSWQDSNDDSYIIPYRSNNFNETGNIDLDSELPLVNQQGEKSLNMIRNQVNYNPDELNLMPERGNEISSPGYDPAFDYEMQLQAEAGASHAQDLIPVETSSKQGRKKSDRDPKSKSTPNCLAKNKTSGPIRRGKPSKLSPLDEARERAEKMRNYKADLQKMKKEKEEEEMKRLQALKIERQKRIAARGSLIPAQSSVTSQQRKQLPTKLSPNSHTKFSDSDPGSSSPLQRVPIRAISLGSSDSKKTTKPGRLSAGSHKSESRLTQSVHSLPDSKNDKTGSAADNKASMARIRRLSEPKIMGNQPVPAVKPLSAQSTETKSKTQVSSGPEIKKMSEIIILDKRKAATLPELKIRTPNGPDIQSKSAAKEKSHKLNVDKSSQTSQGARLKKDEGISPADDVDDNPVIEKTVVMLEIEKPSVPAVQEPDDYLGKGTKADYNAPRAPISPQTIYKDDPKIQESKSRQLSESYEVITSDIDQNPPSTKKTTEESYQAPYARVSSMKESFIGNSEYSQPTPIISQTGGLETVTALVPDSRNSKLEKIPEAADKPLGKESSKGFKRLLKFGRKNHSSTAGDHSMESDNISMTGSVTVDCVTSTTSSNEVHTLKNLISKDESPISSTTPQKASRSFSLLSPFRSKTSDKKQTT